MITFQYKNGKWIFCRDGVYFAIKPSQVEEMYVLLESILMESKVISNDP
jgi:hypothetical protein